MAKEFMNYDEYLRRVSAGIVTDQGNCPVAARHAAGQMEDAGALRAVRARFDSIRFGQIKADLPGITNTTLTRVLRELVRDGLVNRHQFNEISPHVEYSFTDKGRDLMPVFYEITRWGFKHDVGGSAEGATGGTKKPHA